MSWSNVNQGKAAHSATHPDLKWGLEHTAFPSDTSLWILMSASLIEFSALFSTYSRVLRGNKTNVKLQLFRREENKRLDVAAYLLWSQAKGISRWNEMNYIFNVISFIPSWNVFVSKENKCSVREWKQSGISCKLNLITSLEADLIIDSKNINTSFSLIRAVSSSKSWQEAQMNRLSTQVPKVPLSLFHERWTRAYLSCRFCAIL